MQVSSSRCRLLSSCFSFVAFVRSLGGLGETRILRILPSALRSQHVFTGGVSCITPYKSILSLYLIVLLQ